MSSGEIASAPSHSPKLWMAMAGNLGIWGLSVAISYAIISGRETESFALVVFCFFIGLLYLSALGLYLLLTPAEIHFRPALAAMFLSGFLWVFHYLAVCFYSTGAVSAANLALPLGLFFLLVYSSVGVLPVILRSASPFYKMTAWKKVVISIGWSAFMVCSLLYVAAEFRIFERAYFR